MTRHSPRARAVASPRARSPTTRLNNGTSGGWDSCHELGLLGGLAALSLDALTSVAYGPQAMIVILVLAGSAALRWTVPLTVVVAAILVILVFSYTQVISAHSEGGGAYAVAKANLGRPASLLAAAWLVVDYVLTVAVSLAVGAASLASVFPALSHHLLIVSLGALVILTAVNMFGIAASCEAADPPRRPVRVQHPGGARRRSLPLAAGRGDRLCWVALDRAVVLAPQRRRARRRRRLEQRTRPAPRRGAHARLERGKAGVRADVWL